MLPFFCYLFSRLSSFVLFLSFLFLILPILPACLSSEFAEDAPPKGTSSGFMRFLDAGRGSRVSGMAELKDYFRRFGYLDAPPENITRLGELFDEQLETALLSYQRNLGLPATGRLDSQTMSAIVSPRCGVADESSSVRVRASRRYSYFYGEPRWGRSTPMTLSYAFSPDNTIAYLKPAAVGAAFARAFSRWSAVIPVNFTESEDYASADIRIGWYRGAHGDGEAFDGALGVLAHAFSPENGRFHLDGAERWAVDFRRDRSKAAVDLESVAIHEIGHILGLGHSSSKEAVMYPNLSPRSKKQELRIDDVEGIQALYGSNPNYHFDSRLESDVSSSSSGRVVGFTWPGAAAAFLLLVIHRILARVGVIWYGI